MIKSGNLLGSHNRSNRLVQHILQSDNAILRFFAQAQHQKLLNTTILVGFNIKKNTAVVKLFLVILEILEGKWTVCGKLAEEKPKLSDKKLALFRDIRYVHVITNH
jgi:hypothetical protein